MADCLICGHPRREHNRDGCHHQRWRNGRCACTYVVQVALPPDADASEHRVRSDWWDVQARLAWTLMTASRDDLSRWYRLDRFHRAARQAEIEHRRRAEELSQPRQRPFVLVVDPAYETVPVETETREPTLGQRLDGAASNRSRVNAA